jgi:predicted  nucleic acid-binding Zn-ribbon protein
MNVAIPLIPSVAWILATALSMTILLIIFFLYLFQRRKSAVISGLQGDVADLSAQKQLLQADIKAIESYISGQKKELDRLSGEREKQEAIRLDLENNTRQLQAVDQQNNKLRDEVTRLMIEKQTLQDQFDKLRQQEEELPKTLEALQEAISNQKTMNQRELSVIESEHQKSLEELNQKNMRELSKIEEEHSRKINNQLEIMEQQIQEKKYEIDSLEKQKESISTGISEQKEREENLLNKLVEVNATIETKEIRMQSIVMECEAKENRMEDLRKKLETDTQNLNNKKEALTSLKEEIEELRTHCFLEEKRRSDLQQQASQLEKEIFQLEMEKNRLINEMPKIKPDPSDPQPVKDVLKDLLEEPACLKTQNFMGVPIEKDEIQLLQDFQYSLKKENLYFSDRMINAFHTSLKCAQINPLTVLAGISGTGKTLLPIKYSQFMGMGLLVMAVQPRWDSPQDMFGFYNYLENRFKATDLSRALVRMDEFHPLEAIGGSNKDKMLMVLMDEMNLARTEYYFSEFLSKLELRRDLKDRSKRQNAEIVLDMGPGITKESRLWVGTNVLFVGTMNEDESTLSLSDKVLDRSNVLRFGKPKKPESDETNGYEDVSKHLISHDTWIKDWVKPFNQQSEWAPEITGWRDQINNALEKIGRSFGFRTEKAIDTYVANYPGIDDDDVYKVAFADQIEQKIIPKLRGLDVSDSQTMGCLTQIQDVIDQLNDNDFSKAFENAKKGAGAGLFQWHGLSRQA